MDTKVRYSEYEYAHLFLELIDSNFQDDLDVARMMWNCMVSTLVFILLIYNEFLQEYTYKNHEYLEKLCGLLKKVGESRKRQRFFQNIKCPSDNP